jgi:hypothetical protein
MTAMCIEQGLPAWVCYGQVESRFHEVFLHGSMAVSDNSARRGSSGRCGPVGAAVDTACKQQHQPLGSLRTPGRTGLDPAQRVLSGLARAAYRNEVTLRIHGTVEQPAHNLCPPSLTAPSHRQTTPRQTRKPRAPQTAAVRRENRSMLRGAVPGRRDRPPCPGASGPRG